MFESCLRNYKERRSVLFLCPSPFLPVALYLCQHLGLGKLMHPDAEVDQHESTDTANEGVDRAAEGR